MRREEDPICRPTPKDTRNVAGVHCCKQRLSDCMDRSVADWDARSIAFSFAIVSANLPDLLRRPVLPELVGNESRHDATRVANEAELRVRLLEEEVGRALRPESNRTPT